MQSNVLKIFSNADNLVQAWNHDLCWKYNLVQAWNHDLCWKSIISSETELSHEYGLRLRPQEVHVAANQHDIFLSSTQEDAELCSQIHSWMRRMGYIVYSNQGEQVIYSANGNGML
jgi:hypothetical protein